MRFMRCCPRRPFARSSGLSDSADSTTLHIRWETKAALFAPWSCRASSFWDMEMVYLPRSQKGWCENCGRSGASRHRPGLRRRKLRDRPGVHHRRRTRGLRLTGVDPVREGQGGEDCG